MDRSTYSDRSMAASRKLQRRRPEPPRLPSITYPERLRPGPDKDDDVSSAPGMQAHMNQSMFSLIAAAGSKTDFHPRFGEDSSGSETEKDEEKGDTGGTGVKGQGTDRAGAALVPKAKVSAARQLDSKEQRLAIGAGTTAGLDGLEEKLESETEQKKHDRKREKEKRRESKLLQSLPRLRVKSHREKNYMSQSMILPPQLSGSVTPSPGPITPRDAPVMRKIIEAESVSRAEPSRTKDTSENQADAGESEGRESMDSRPKLAGKLKEIFGFEEPEEVIAEYPCWLLKSVLLQGYLYITENHFCFYAYLPKKTKTLLKSGVLLKKSRRGPKYNKQWFVLKGDVLSYYDSPSAQYFQAGHVDLRFATSASLDPIKEDSKEASRSFTLTTPDRIYYFTADSDTSANDWVKVLQKVIFRTHNDGNSVKIALPIANVLDIEESPVVEVAKTIKVQVLEDEGTFAFDEYYFSFFSFGQDAISVMRSLIPEPPPQEQIGDDSAEEMRKRKTRSRGDSVGAKAISPGSHDEDFDAASAERRRRSSCSPAMTARHRPRDSFSEFSPVMRASDRSESFVDSMAASSGANLSVDDFQSSGSQVLSRSDIFRPKSERRSESPGRYDVDTEKHDIDHLSRKRQESRSTTPRIPGQSDMEIASSHVDVDTASPSLKKLIKAGQYPLQRAAGLAGMLHRGSKDMSALLATKSMGYVEKVSGMWAGGRKHYRHDFDGPEDMEEDLSNDPEAHEKASARFRQHFGLADSERLLAAYFGFLHRVLPLYGKIYVSDRFFCFRSLLPGTNTKIILPLRDIETVHKEKGFRLRYSALVVVIQGFEELFFEFSQREVRDDCAVFLHRCLDASKMMSESMHSSHEEEEAKLAKAEHSALMAARQHGKTAKDIDLSRLGDSINHDGAPTVNFDDPKASILNFKPNESLRITCLTIGSRGDVQPYIALCKGLLAEGHKPKIATHAEFEGWVRSHGIDFEPVDGDPAELMRICIENGMFTYSFLREASSKFRGWIDDLLSSSWKACQGSDVLIESPSAMAGIHIAEALKIPYFRAFTMPWTRTRAYPHAFAVPEHRRGGAYNWFTYVMFDNIFWAAIAGQVNRWRKKELRLQNTTLEQLQTNKVPFLYNFSPSVVAPPIDFSDWVRVTGYWFLDEGANHEPDPALLAFIKKARADGKKLIYIGFGSIVVANPKIMTETIVEAVLKADVRCILSKGWSDRLGKNSDKIEVLLPPEIHQIRSCPHDWLFKQVDCAVHHGGAGTTGASLRAGLPTIIKPFFGDQFFFANRVVDLQVGAYLQKLNVSVLSRAIWEATHSERMIRKARLLGEQIRKEDGVGTAIQAIYRDMDYAKSLIKSREEAAAVAAAAAINPESVAADGGNGIDDEIGDEESWTFIEEEGDPDLIKRMAAMDGFRQQMEPDIEQTVGIPHGIGAATALESQRAQGKDTETGQMDAGRITKEEEEEEEQDRMIVWETTTTSKRSNRPSVEVEGSKDTAKRRERGERGQDNSSSSGDSRRRPGKA